MNMPIDNEKVLAATNQNQDLLVYKQPSNSSATAPKNTGNTASACRLDPAKLKDRIHCVQELNKRYALAKVKTKTFVLDEIATPPDMLNKSDFLDLYANKTVRLGPKDEQNLGHYWFTHPDRREYLDGMVFDPSGANSPDQYNLWRGFAVKPDPNLSCGRILAHIDEVICSKDTVCYEYLLDWLALMVQKPESPPGVAICLLSGQGTGKGLFAQYIGKLLGPHYKHILDKGKLLGRFTGQLEDAVFVFADELDWNGDKRDTGILKGLITEQTRMMERKYVEAFEVKNCIHLLIASNERWAVPAEMDDRRFFVLEVSERRKGDTTYFSALVAEMDNGGPSAFLALLRNRDISSFDPRQFPKTAARVDQQLRSLEPLDAWLYDILDAGIHPVHMGAQPWPKDVFKDEFHAAYQQWFVRSRKPGSPESKGHFTQALKQYGITTKKVLDSLHHKRVPGYQLPDLATLRQAFEDRLGHSIPWDPP